MKILEENNEKQWQDFVSEQNCVPPQFTLGWKDFVYKTYKNCEPIYYINLKEEIVKTIFPFFLVKSKIFGDRLISQPFIDIGGLLGEFDKNFMLNVINNLKEQFKGKATNIEIRLNTFSENYKEFETFLLNQNFDKKSGKQQFILRLRKEEDLWNSFKRITRKGIKKANKSGLKLNEINNEKEIEIFYKLYLKRMKNFGTPQHSYDYFLNLFAEMKENFKGLNCYKDEKLIGSLIVLYTKDYMYAAYNFSEYEFLMYQPNDLLYWEIIKWAIKKDIKYFDFGQCEANAEEKTHAEGIYNFKSKWLGDLYERQSFYYCFKQDSKQDIKSKKDNLIKIWRKLPLFVIKRLGPKIASQLAL